MVGLLQEVRLGRNDDFEFIVSPDAFRYTMHKVSLNSHFPLLSAEKKIFSVNKFCISVVARILMLLVPVWWKHFITAMK